MYVAITNQSELSLYIYVIEIEITTGKRSHSSPPRGDDKIMDTDGNGQNASASRNIIITECCPANMRKRDVWRIDQFHLLKKIGSGYASTVYLGTCRTSGNQVAIKLYHKNKLSELNFFQVSREIRIHSSLDHKHIIQLWAAFEDQYGIYLVSEFASKGDVFADVEKRGGQMTEADTVRQVIHPFLLSLCYLHGLKIMHRDIKPENLLFSGTGVLKVADFGLSINFETERPVTRVGTLDYMAPEVVICPDKHKPNDHKEMKNLYYTAVVDAWAVGVLAYELIIGRPPFDKGHKKLTIAEIINAEPSIPPYVSEGAANFIKWSLTKDQYRRPTVYELIEHPWITSLMRTPAPRRTDALRQMIRHDSFAENRKVGMGRIDSDASSPEVVVQNLQVQALQQSGRVLGHSSSMNATDMMRWRDIAFNADSENTYDYPGAADMPKRNSDGLGQQPLSRRPSQAQGLSRSPGVPDTLSRHNSGALGMSPGHLPMSQDSYVSPKPMTREEMFQSLQASAQKLNKAVSFGRPDTSSSSPSSGKQVHFPPYSPSTSALAAQRGMLQRSHSSYMNPVSPGTGRPGTSSPTTSRYAPAVVRQKSMSSQRSDHESVMQDLGKLSTHSDAGMRQGSPSSPRPQPPSGLSPAAQQRFFAPSRLGGSFTQPGNPPSTLSITGKGSSPRSSQRTLDAVPGSGSISPCSPNTEIRHDNDKDVTMTEADMDSNSLMKSAKGIFGGLKKVFS